MEISNDNDPDIIAKMNQVIKDLEMAQQVCWENRAIMRKLGSTLVHLKFNMLKYNESLTDLSEKLAHTNKLANHMQETLP